MTTSTPFGGLSTVPIDDTDDRAEDCYELVQRRGRPMATDVSVQIAVTPSRWAEAAAAADACMDWFDEVDARLSRFRPESELSRLNTAAGDWFAASDVLYECAALALESADSSNGLFDPTMLRQLCALGYDRDFAAIGGQVTAAPAARVTVAAAADWRAVRLDGDLLTVPAGVLLDLGATAKAHAADMAAADIAERLGTGALVALGGDIATAGRAPEGGWRVLVQDGAAEPGCAVTLPAGAIATSSTIARSWQHGERAVHHILDPRSLRPVAPVWRTVSVAAHTCVRANTLATAAIVRGRAAPRFLTATGAPARLVAADGRVTTLGAWPAETRPVERSPR